jgi:hypothetical protein
MIEGPVEDEDRKRPVRPPEVRTLRMLEKMDKDSQALKTLSSIVSLPRRSCDPGNRPRWTRAG